MSYDSPRPGADPQARTWAMLAHLGGILAYFFVGWVTALVVWLVYRDRDASTAENARSALNFQLSLLIGLVICKIVQAIPVLGFLGTVGILAIAIISLVLSVLAAVAVNRGGTYRYPFGLELVR